MEELLYKLGLDEKEAKVYLAVFQHGKIRAATLARTLGLKRTTVYSVARQLIDKNLIKQDLGQSVLCFVANPPEELYWLIKTEEKKLAAKKQIAGLAVEQLSNFSQNKGLPIPKIIFVPEQKIQDQLYKQTPVWAESIRRRGGTWWGFQDHTFVEHYEKWIDWSWESGAQRGINLKLLSNQEEKKTKKKTFADRVIKFWSYSQNFTATMWICGDYLITLNTRGHQHYLIEIHDVLLAHNQREIFKGIWQSEIEKNRP